MHILKELMVMRTLLFKLKILPALNQFSIVSIAAVLLFSFTLHAQRQMEKLDRGVNAIYVSSGKVLVSWRIFGDDSPAVSFNLYMEINGGNATKVNSTPIAGKSNYMVANVDLSNTNKFYIKTIHEGIEESVSNAYTLKGAQPYISIPLDIPANGVSPANESYTYSANDCSVADLDGDGDYEIIVKWAPSNAIDNKTGTFTGNTIFDAYTLEGIKLWRIDLGDNIRSGPHYNPFMVYDLDGDGRAELACKTAPGTKDATGNYLRKGPAAQTDHTIDYRNSGGMILSGPEYLTLFNGLTGEEMFTVNYTPRRHPDTEDPTKDQLEAIWEDSYGNRVDRFLACIAYLDGVRPSLIMCRGYYGRSVLAAYDLRGGELTQRWVFDTMDKGNDAYDGQGDHSLSVADVDADGKDEIIYGSMTVDDDGTGLYSTGLGHGDALHVGDLDPTRTGMEVFEVHENLRDGATLRDVATGDIIWQHKNESDVGRGVAFDIDPNYPGVECWAADGRGVFSSATGELITTTYPITAGGGKNYNAAIWWDGDLLRELFDKTVINKWRPSDFKTSRMMSVYQYGVTVNNDSKSNPCLIADIFGDWREELILRKSDSQGGDELRIFSTPYESDHGFYTLMHDPQYRLSVVWQNVGYNQPGHTSFFLGADMDTPPTPDAIYVNKAKPYPIDKSIPVIATLNDTSAAITENGYAYLADYNARLKISDERYIAFNYFQNPAPGTAIGKNNEQIEVTVYVNDGNGNKAAPVTFNVTAVDKTAPVFTSAFGNHTLNANGACQRALPDYSNYVSAADNATTDVVVSMAPEAGTLLIGHMDSLLVTLTATDLNGNGTDTAFWVKLEAPECASSALQANVENNVSVYPNPANDKIWIGGFDQNYGFDLTLKRITGQIVYQTTNSKSNEVDVSALPAGIYLLEVVKDNRAFSTQVVKR